MHREIEERARELTRHKVPYVHARVVLAERPTSAKPGDEALVLADGTMIGFVGGTCGETTIRSQGLSLLESGESVLLRITPEPEPAQPGKVTVVNECLSGGTFEVFLEPVLPPATLVVVGASPIAVALRRVAAAAGFDVAELQGTDLATATAVVIASHGRDEADPLLAAVRAGVPYVALVASPRRGAGVLADLDLTAEERRRIRTPAGLDIGARTAPEVAISILAQLVADRPRPAGRQAADDDAAAAGGVTTAPDAGSGPPARAVSGSLDVATGSRGVGNATDPVCGMQVAMVAASLHFDVPSGAHAGERYWFCGPGCLRAFAADPAAYLPG